jgi:hypothetical protein
LIQGVDSSEFFTLFQICWQNAEYLLLEERNPSVSKRGLKRWSRAAGTSKLHIH